MELTYDWKNFQSFFYAKKKLTPNEILGPVYLVVDGRVVISAFSEDEDLSDWGGATYDEVAAELPHREVVLFERDQVDQWMSKSMGMAHFYDQIELLRSESKPMILNKSKLRTTDLPLQRHFLLSAIQCWWSKLFPSTYGIYVRLDSGAVSALFLLVQRGKIQSFNVPDLSGMLPNRRKVPADIVKHLSEKHLVPVQGLFLSTQEWFEWGEMANPWPKIATVLKTNRTKLVPFKWGVAFLIACRGYLGY